MASVLSPSSLLLRFPNPNPNPSRTVLPRIKPLSTSPSDRRLRPAAALRAPAAASPPSPSILSDSTRTISTLASIALAISKLFLSSASSSLSNLRSISFPPESSLLFARLKSRPSGYLNTPLTVVAAGMTKWLDIYSGILMVRVLLSWFPNIPWERQPLCAIRDLCDPYLNLFRNIIPPVFDTLDVSPLLAFAVLGTLGSILNNTRGMVY